MIKVTVISNVEEWEKYRAGFEVPCFAHRPMIVPSFPVLVISEVVASGVEHHFIERRQFQVMLDASRVDA